MIFGALKEDFRRMRASWTGSRLSLPIALPRSAHRASRASLSAGPSVSGAPKRVAFSFDVITKSRKAGSVVVGQCWISSHFLALRCKPRDYYYCYYYCYYYYNYCIEFITRWIGTANQIGDANQYGGKCISISNFVQWKLTARSRSTTSVTVLVDGKYHYL